MHVFELYSEVMYPLVETMKTGLPKLLRVKKAVKHFSLPEGVVVIDIETTGLEPEDHEMVSYGLFKGSTAEVVVRLTGKERDLIEALEEDLKTLMESNARLWAFYSSFEESWLQTKLSEEFEPLTGYIGELKVVKGRLTDIVPYEFGDRSDGSRIPRLWQNWLDRASLGSLTAIIHHNMADIIREALLYVLDENGAFRPLDSFRDVEIEFIGEPYKPFNEFVENLYEAFTGNKD